MKNRKIFIIIIILIIFIVPIITFASIKIYNKDSEGRTIVYSAEDMKDLEPGTEISLAIPANTNIDDELSDEEIKKEKGRLKVEAERKDNQSNYSLTEKEKAELNEELSQFENKELKDTEKEFKEIFSKYYGEDSSKELFDNIEKEIYENEGEYEIPESSKVMLKKAIELLKNDNVTTNDKETIKYILNEVDTSFIEDAEILRDLESAGIELD